MFSILAILNCQSLLKNHPVNRKVKISFENVTCPINKNSKKEDFIRKIALFLVFMIKKDSVQ
jgi:hypothetical protein